VVEIPRHNSICNWGFTGLCSSLALKSLCNVLCKASLDFLDVAVVANNTQDESRSFCALDKVLKPLDYFRNVKKVTLGDADLDDTPNVIDEEISTVGLLSHFTDYSGLQDELTNRMAEPEIIELTCQMYARLLRYARAFERNDDIKMQMALSAEERGESLSNELNCERLLDGQPCRPSPSLSRREPISNPGRVNVSRGDIPGIGKRG
jgi:hypothetical protein